ncbi:hypothetical protein [Piscinibacter sp.]|uniref:hypothetical protein n=1 Tax=Piscinibacter sp. TaxID=1903157 RepID=UPI002C2AE8DB|nr:hypothetical protein [Albitalea sp.]HUG21077.1 hypothetical protein [Albitalea sp.]
MTAWILRGCLAGAALALLSACAGGPPPPDWQADAKAALDAAVTAHLKGDSRVAAQELARARSQIASTGRPELMARAELMHCAAQVASLAFEPCTGFERLRRDAAAAELAYADHLAARALAREDIERLPPAQRTAATAVAGGSASVGAVQDIADPLSRLIAIAVLFQAGHASPQMIALAADAASAQGWRRPLLAWLKIQALQAQRAGDADAAQRLERRIELVQSGR